MKEAMAPIRPPAVPIVTRRSLNRYTRPQRNAQNVLKIRLKGAMMSPGSFCGKIIDRKINFAP